MQGGGWVSSRVQGGRWLVVVTGWTGAGKSTIAEALANELDVTVASFDWVMSALQRGVGWDLLSGPSESHPRESTRSRRYLASNAPDRRERDTLRHFRRATGQVRAARSGARVLGQLSEAGAQLEPIGSPWFVSTAIRSTRRRSRSRWVRTSRR